MSAVPSRENGSLLTIVKAQIVFLLSTLQEENYIRNQAEIRSLSEQHGVETYLHFIRRLIAASQSRLSSSSSAPSTFEPSSALTFRLLVQETQRLARDPFLADRFRDGVDKGEGDIFRHFDFQRFSDRLGLRPLERLVLASSIVSTTTTRRELAMQAANIIRLNFDEAVLSICQHPSFDHADLSPSQVAKLLSHLLSDPPPDAPILDASQRVALIVAAQAKYGLEIMAPILQKIFPTLSLSPGTSLVQTLCQLGPDLTSDPDTVRALLRRFTISETSPPRESQVTEIVSTLARYAAEGTALCDVGSLIRAISALPGAIDWSNVILAFDRPERTQVDTATLKLIIAILPNTPRETERPSVSGFWRDWSNTLYQLHLLDALISLPNDAFNFVSLPGRRIVTVDDVAAASPTIKALAANVQGHTWNSLDLIETLVRIGDSENADVKACVREMLDKAVKISAELVHMGLLQVSKPWGATQQEYSNKLLAMFLAGHPNHQLVFMRIWQIDPTYLTSAFRDFYAESALNITRILDVAQDLKILDSLLDVRPFTFALDVAALASRREYLNLDKWLSDNATQHGEAFTRAVLDFLDIKINSELARQDPQVEQRTMPLNPQTITIFIRMLRGCTMSPADAKYFTEIRNLGYQLHPRLMNLTPGSDAEPGLTVVSFSTEVETEVESIYKRMYEGDISIDQVIDMLQDSKNSTNTREKDVFACTLHSLFDEYKFFQSYYPARELAMTGYLFGSIIQHHLIDYIPLGIAIRYVLDAIRSPPDSNLFTFGVEALLRFESRLSEWPPLCNTLLKLPHLHTARPDIVEIVRRALARSDDPREGGVIGDGTEATTLAFTAIHADHISDEPFTEPEPEDSERILFIVNNLALNNFQTKTEEMHQRFKNDYSRWFANYLVDQRVSTEPNNHHIYLQFIDALDNKLLMTHVLHETLHKSSLLLNSEKTLSSSSERTILKNLGSWLGSFTLARNRPIKHHNMSFKDLLLEGYDSNRLIVAIPFICKILEHCTKSTVFTPPNPWLMAIISLLVELYHFAELKLNLKFEIEVLCKSLGVDLEKTEATMLLRNRPSTVESLAGPPLPDLVPDIDSLPIGNYDPSHPGHNDSLPQQPQQVLQLNASSPTQSQQAMGMQIEAIIADIPNHVTINPQLASLGANPSFKRAVQVAVERAVREIILPVVERSVTIAGISTRELVSKDFALEGDEEVMRKAGHSMAQKLAGSLALVTCKEPLRSNMVNHVRHLLTEHGYTEQAVPEQVVMLLVADNVDIACGAIEKAAMERAVAELDEALAVGYANRRLHREQRPGQPFWDSTMSPSMFAANLPELLRPQASGLHLEQLRVYDDFGPEARRYLTRPSSTGPFLRSDPTPYPATSPQPSNRDVSLSTNTLLTNQQCLERFAAAIIELERLLDQMQPNQTASSLPPNHDISAVIRQILITSTQAADREGTALEFSQKIVQLLFKTPTQLGREIYVALLDRLCEASAQVSKEAIEWLVYAEDERKFNVPVISTLLRMNLVPITEQDLQLAKLITRDFRPAPINFTANLIRDCLFSAVPYASRQHFRHSLDALAHAAHAGKGTDIAARLLEDLRGISRGPSDEAPDTAMYDQLGQYFAEWVRLFQRSPTPEKSFVSWVTQLTAQGILKGEEISSFFYRVCTETSIALYSEAIASGDTISAFQPVDALSRLIVLMIKYNGDAAATKVHYLTKIISIVVVVLAHFHEESGLAFPQKPFFRLFSSLFNDLHTIEATLQGAYFQLLIALCDTFNTLQPTYFPGFAFSWISLVSHRLFMPKLLLSNNREGWSAFHRLLISLFKFLAPFLRTADLQNASRNLFRGAQRLLLVLLHDFPEFLAEYYFTICDVIPARCIQLRNVVLSAFPPKLALPDPHIRNLDWDSVPEMGPIPPILSDFTLVLVAGDHRALVDQYLTTQTPASFPKTLRELIMAPRQTPNPSSEMYNLPLLNALVMYVGVSSVAQAKTRTGSALFVATDPGVTLLKELATELDSEGQHHLLGSMVMHLRYPNAHTHWFSSLILYLFTEVKAQQFQEITAKVLLERFIVHRPHPWGALVTFIELLRNPKYDFWNHEFVRVAPEITTLLESVSRSIAREL